MRKTSTWQFPVTWLLAIVLIFTTWHFFAFYQRLTEWSFLNSIPLALSPIVLILSSFIWTSLGVAITWGIVYKKSWTIAIIWTWVILIGLAMLINDISIIDETGTSSLNILKIGLYLSGIALIAWTLSQDVTQAHFGVHNEQQ